MQTDLQLQPYVHPHSSEAPRPQAGCLHTCPPSGWGLLLWARTEELETGSSPKGIWHSRTLSHTTHYTSNNSNSLSNNSGQQGQTWFRMYLSMPVSFFPSALLSVGRLFIDGVRRQDLSEHWKNITYCTMSKQLFILGLHMAASEVANVMFLFKLQ